jgi:hypothetical protein
MLSNVTSKDFSSEAEPCAIFAPRYATKKNLIVRNQVFLKLLDSGFRTLILLP